MTGTLDLPQAIARRWDCLVVGAGPAGSVAARQLAARGYEVLLLERAHFPRAKVCGGCLHPRAQATLRELGLGDLPVRHGAVALQRVILATSQRRCELRLPTVLGLSRSCLDAALVAAAVAAGASFLPGTTARQSWPAGDQRLVRCRGGDLRCRLLLAADGLGARLLARGGEISAPPHRRARVGLGATLPGDPNYPDGTVTMAVGGSGYVGLAPVENGQLVVAAALAPECCRPATVRQLLLAAGLPPPRGLAQADWRGTLPLTRRARCPGAERALLLGDAAGYLEPVTGEGIAWALEAAMGVVPWAEAALAGWTADLPARWEQWLAAQRRERWRRCAATAVLLRASGLLGPALALGQRFPRLAQGVLRAAYVNGGR